MRRPIGALARGIAVVCLTARALHEFKALFRAVSALRGGLLHHLEEVHRDIESINKMVVCVGTARVKLSVCESGRDATESPPPPTNRPRLTGG